MFIGSGTPVGSIMLPSTGSPLALGTWTVWCLVDPVQNRHVLMYWTWSGTDLCRLAEIQRERDTEREREILKRERFGFPVPRALNSFDFRMLSGSESLFQVLGQSLFSFFRAALILSTGHQSDVFFVGDGVDVGLPLSICGEHSAKVFDVSLNLFLHLFTWRICCCFLWGEGGGGHLSSAKALFSIIYL